MNGNLLLIDESRLFCEGLRGIMSDSPFRVAHEARTVEDFVEQRDRFADIHPDLVLLDSRSDDKSLAGQFECLLRMLPHARIVFLTDQVRMSRLVLAFSIGVDGYLLKDLSANALRESLRLVQVGEKVFPSSLAAMLINSYRGHISNEPMNGGHAAGPLSKREKQILGCLALGLPNKTIASQLGITESTVKAHLKALLMKIKVKNRTQAAIWGLTNGHTDDSKSRGARDYRNSPDSAEQACV